MLERLVPQLQAAPKPDEVPGFWTAAQQLCAVGWFDAATDLLGLHSIWADWQLGRSAVAPAAEAMEAAIVLMRTFPRLGQGKCHSLVAFEAYRQEWLLRCREALAQESLWSGVSGTATGEGARARIAPLRCLNAWRVLCLCVWGAVGGLGTRRCDLGQMRAGSLRSL